MTMADHRFIPITEHVEHELNVFGCPARVLLELDLGRSGGKTLVPIGDLAEIKCGLGPHAQISVVFRGAILKRVSDVIDEVQFRGLD